MKRNAINWVYVLLMGVMLAISGCSGGGSSGGGDDSTNGNNSMLPTANAGNDITVNKYQSVLLDASGSSDATSYKWTQTDGPPVTLSDNASSAAEFTPISAATYTFMLEVSNAIGSDSDEVVVIAQEISTVSITSPTPEETIAVTQPTIEIAGSAGPNITSVSVMNRTSGSSYAGRLDGKGFFSAQGVALIEGDNLLEVAGTDNTGALTTDSLLVVFNRGVNFLSAPGFSINSAFINETVETVVSVAIEENQKIVSDGVRLVAFDDTGAVLPRNVSTLHDDGDVTNGDDIAGDGVYSGKVTINKPVAGIYGYRVGVRTDSVDYSSPVYFTVLTPLTDKEIQSAEKLTKSAFTNNFPAIGSTFTRSEFEIYKDEIIAELLSFEDVVNAFLSADGNSIAVEFMSGLIHTIDFVYTDSKGGGGDVFSDNADVSSAQPVINYHPHQSKLSSFSQRPLFPSLLDVSPSGSKGDDNAIGSYRTLALSPFRWQFEPYDDVDGAYVLIQHSDTPSFMAEEPVVDYDVTVEHFKNLNQYGVVVISAHGGLEGNDPVIYTEEEATSEKKKIYQKDLDAKRLMISQKILIWVENGDSLGVDGVASKNVFKIAPSFITQYNHNMPNTLVYMSICQGKATNALADAFMQAGAGAFVGYTDIVQTSYAFDAGKTFFESMIRGKNVKDSVKDAADANGRDDGDDTPAALAYSGNGNLVLERTGMQNSGFEDNLKYWEQNGGDVRIISKLSSLSPRDGRYMAILSSGLGAVTDSDAVITQQFKVPAGVDSISFDYDVVSEEPLEFVRTVYDDKFRAVLIDEDGNEIALAYETVNSSSWTSIGGSQENGGMFDGGDETAFHTGWKSVKHQIRSLAGQTVTLKFRVWDAGDSVYDTAALIDKIILK